MSPDELARTLQSFLSESPRALLLEDDEPIFDFTHARYSISSDRGKCVLHLWSDERNVVRRVLDAETKNGALRMKVQRFGQAKPSELEICRDPDRRSPSARRAGRAAYQRLLRAVLERAFPDWTLDKLTSAADLEKSFGPVYCRGLLRRGRSAVAVLGVNAGELQPGIDSALTFALLWLQAAREKEAARIVVEGLRLIVPAGRAAIVRERMAHLDRSAAKFELYELDERDRALTLLDTADRGNIATRLARNPDVAAAHERFAAEIARVRNLAPDCEVAVLAPTELAFRLHGLEFARARIAAAPGALRNQHELVFGPLPSEIPVSDDNAKEFAQFARMLALTRRASGDHANPLFRMHPERWLESLVVRDVARLDARLDPTFVYSQVPAFSASDRAMIDVLTCTRDGRLAVLELKADEDIHLPLQGLDYWARVVWHQQRCEFQRFGYFPGRELSSEPPLLLLVAPALRVHPQTDTLLRYLAPEIDCELIGVDENWRQELRVVFRKRTSKGQTA
jgi:hypothetical protein